MTNKGLLVHTALGLYCPKADVYLDPWKPVKKAILSHGHADHARWGSSSYLCTPTAAPVIKYRLGDINLETLPFGEEKLINGVSFSFHPAGHILGSAQIKVSYKGEIVVFSGDYKTANDGFSEAFEPVKCHTFITESTFGLPVYHWQDQKWVFNEMEEWCKNNRNNGQLSILYGYSLGKAQRILQGLPESIGSIFTHSTIEAVLNVMRNQGVSLKNTIPVNEHLTRADLLSGVIIAPPAVQNSNWLKKFEPIRNGVVSGWMALRGARRRRNADKGFVLSDHADWEGLNEAISLTGAENVFVTHGYTDILSKWLIDKGLNAHPLETNFEGDEVL
ncbi:MAG: ligase-associated DNA damage response exonuclease [Haliscomenobacter sp.]|jgi:putative mRNA 3-end processing factor|nr:ligase-associated DNA damage response exonuclease [Haliscomenobacter sp.]MCF8317762.1 ligase-associated DNA damage response exonuclease [Haliscomenobacter sp.]